MIDDERAQQLQSLSQTDASATQTIESGMFITAY